MFYLNLKGTMNTSSNLFNMTIVGFGKKVEILCRLSFEKINVRLRS